MERVQAVFADADPHLWIEAWQTHQRHLVYSTFTTNEIVISTDFSAQFDHKCAWTLTCEHPPRSNQAVYVVTHSPGVDDGERTVYTDVWRMFSEMKGDALFHNTALSHIVEYYANELPGLEQAHVFTDGCRGQYKGRRNFAKIAAFPSLSLHKGVKLRHHFAASHHFKGPHDAFGKDPKFLARMAERHQRARIATTHDLYQFCVQTMPAPKKLTAKQIVTGLAKKDLAELQRKPPSELPPHLRPAAPECGAAEGTAEAGVGGGGGGSRTEAEGEAEGDSDGEGCDGDGGDGEMRCAGRSGAEAGEADEDAEGEGDAEAELLAAAVEGEQDVAEGGEGDGAPSDAEEEAEGAGDFEFVFDETGARVRPEEEAAREAAADAADEIEARGTATLAPRKRRRRVIQITEQAAGQEHTKEGDVREVEQGPRKPGIFTARRYFWGYYAPANQGGSTCTVVPLGQVAKPGECHALLDAAANTDADAVAGSNATYEYAGMDAAQPEMLFTRTFTCACAACRRPGTVSVSYRECPFMTSTGRWRQQTVHSAHGVARVAAQSRQKVQDFAKRTQPDQMFAVFGSFTDGGRPYWLLLCKKGGIHCTKRIEAGGWEHNSQGHLDN